MKLRTHGPLCNRAMLFTQRYWEGLKDGSVTLAFRRWRRPTVRQGGTLKSPGGLLAIDEVARVSLGSLRVSDARAAGHESLAELKRELSRHDGALYRVVFHRAGEDPRVELRSSPLTPAAEDRATVSRFAWGRSRASVHPRVSCS